MTLIQLVPILLIAWSAMREDGPTPVELLQKAVEASRAGEVDAALKLCEQVLKVDPRQAGASCCGLDSTPLAAKAKPRWPITLA